MKNPTAMLRRHGLRPKKRLGQSFLKDASTMARIVAAADIGATDTVVEIGAGTGVMTELIAARAARVIAVEIDPALAGILREHVAKDHGNVEIVEGDALAFDYRAAAEASASGIVKVIGNIPYYISTLLFFAVIDARHDVESAIFMFQSEVAERIVAFPDSKNYGIPSVMAAMYTRVSRVLTVPPSCFYPPPRVTSTVVKIVMRRSPLVALTDPEFFQKLVRTSFARRRKTILNNLRQGRLAGWSEDDILRALTVTGIDGRRRAETVSAGEFGALSNTLLEKKLLDK
jgi:16S rRNA (adenine1518-N6/adenine1519-N6)-dimethyltransferase